MKRALVIGALGQDGYYLSRQLHAMNYEVVGTSHRLSNEPDPFPFVDFRRLSLQDERGIARLLEDVQPDEIYNLAARASSAQLFDDAVSTGDINGLAVARLLAHANSLLPSVRFCQALSSEVFAMADESPQTESTPPSPCNAYGAAKAYAWHLVRAFRAQRGMFVCGALLYNHESPRRPPHFVTRKVAQAVARIAAGAGDRLSLGPAHHRRDWGHAADAVRAMHLMLQHDEPADYVVATGVTHSVAELCDTAFATVGLDYRDHVDFSASDDRRREALELRGDPRLAREKLDGQPRIRFEELIQGMVREECRALAETAEPR
jgi:GDPmannose 4,6-dehydratase